jgi:hypothetical protein
MQFIRLPKVIDFGERVLPELVIGLDGHLECTEHQYYCSPADPSESTGLLSYPVVEK